MEGGRSFFFFFFVFFLVFIFIFLRQRLRDGIGGREELTTSGQAGQRIRTKTANLSRQGKGFTTTTRQLTLIFVSIPQKSSEFKQLSNHNWFNLKSILIDIIFFQNIMVMNISCMVDWWCCHQRQAGCDKVGYMRAGTSRPAIPSLRCPLTPDPGRGPTGPKHH